MYIFISFPQTNPMWFQLNISQPQMGIFQPQSTNINHKQSQTIIQFSPQFQQINIVHGLWTRGRIYIYIDIFIYI